MLGEKEVLISVLPGECSLSWLIWGGPARRVPLSGFSYMKEHGFHLLKYMKGAGNLSFRSVKGPTGLRDIFYECGKSRENLLVL